MFFKFFEFDSFSFYYTELFYNVSANSFEYFQMNVAFKIVLTNIPVNFIILHLKIVDSIEKAASISSLFIVDQSYS